MNGKIDQISPINFFFLLIKMTALYRKRFKFKNITTKRKLYLLCHPINIFIILYTVSTYLIPMSNKTKSVKFSVENSVFNPFYGLNINFYLFNMLEVVVFLIPLAHFYFIRKKIKNMRKTWWSTIKLDGNRIALI